MTARHLDYRIRVATPGAPEVEGHVDFVLDASSQAGDPEEVVGRLNQAPVVTGSLVHPLDGATELRPFTVRVLDKGGALIQSFTQIDPEPFPARLSFEGRWNALGRLADVQYAPHGTDEWTSYGTGRISGLDELEGPKQFRVQISDESWVARRSRIFETTRGTTQWWPMGRRGVWKGTPRAIPATATLTEQGAGNLLRYRLAATPVVGGKHNRGRIVTDMHKRWARSDRLPSDELDFSADGEGGNFRFLRLHLFNPADLDPENRVVSEFAASGDAGIDFEAPFVGDPAWNAQYLYMWDGHVVGGVSTWHGDWEFFVWRDAESQWVSLGVERFFSTSGFMVFGKWLEIADLQAGDKFGITQVEGPDIWDAMEVQWNDEGPLPDEEQTYEIVSFGALNEASILLSLDTAEENTQGGPDTWNTWILDVWIRADELPEGTSAYLYAPGAPPDEVVPGHIGMSDSWEVGFFDPVWGTPPEQNGFIHPADLTRRYFEDLGQRYDADALAEIEADDTFPALAPRLTSVPSDPEKWMQGHVWGPSMLLALKDSGGRRKLKDIRPPPEDLPLDDLPVLDETNARHHRWRLVGREMMNSVVWRYLELKAARIDPFDLFGPFAPFRSSAEALDDFEVAEPTLEPIQAPDAEIVGVREREFSALSSLADPTADPEWIEACIASGVGMPFTEIGQQHTDWMLSVYQHGPQIGSGQIGRTLADSLEEGDYAIVDCESLQIVNTGPRARSGLMLVLMLSITRRPADADSEYLVIRPAEPMPEFEDPCPEPE